MQPVLTKEDYRIIMDNLKGGLDKHRCSRQEAEALVAELKRAKLVPTSRIDPSTRMVHCFIRTTAPFLKDSSPGNFKFPLSPNPHAMVVLATFRQSGIPNSSATPWL